MKDTISSFSHVLEARDEGSRPKFNAEFLIFVAVSSALSIFFLLYFNRLFASAISWGIRTWTWHQYRIYIDIQAIQISLLAGRIFFTGLRYHGANETFICQHGYVTWRYWLRRVRTVDIMHSRKSQLRPNSSSNETAKYNNAELPCRIHVDLIGLEWFVYNRSPVYDSILAGLGTDSPGSSSNDYDKDEGNLRSRKPRGTATSEDKEQNEKNYEERFTSTSASSEKQDHKKLPRNRSSVSGSADDETGDVCQTDLPLFLQLLPIHVECQKAAIVLGNENTKAILIVKADSIAANVDASETETPDPYRQVFKVQLQHPVVEMKENEDYKEDQVERTIRERDDALGREPVTKRSVFRYQRRKALSSLRNMVPYWRRSVESFSADSRNAAGVAASHIPGHSQWQGLSRYIDDKEQDDKARWSSVEYAALTTILDSPELTLTMYWDAVGKVPDRSQLGNGSGTQNFINGEESPAWGMDLSIKGGTMNYGPWADRQRADLQRVFVPYLCKDATPAQPLEAGAWRAPTQFKLRVELDDAMTLRVPIREDSKNWRWRGKEPPIKHQERPSSKRKQKQRAKKDHGKADATQLRPAGWLEVKVPCNSSIAYSMDMFATLAGFSNSLQVDMPSTELWSSVNHDLLWRSGAQRISCDLSNPITWNAMRNWHFSIYGDQMELFILRDHIFLLTDLVDDWTTGPPPDYLTFTPFKYHLNLQLKDLKLYLNINDANIIDKATSIEDNTYFVLSTPCLKTESCIPVDTYRPNKNAIPFDVRAESLQLALQVPQWNTQAAFMTSKDLAQIEGLFLDGKYHYNATTSTANTDTLELNVRAQSPCATLHGFLIRYALLLKDNYFGENVHFRTFDEYQEQLQIQERNPEADVADRPPAKKSNDFDVMLSVKLDDPRILVPTNLYSSKRFLQAELASLSVDLRFTNYYMDMEVELSPLSVSLGDSQGALDSPSISSSSTQLFIDGLRVFGHRLFGLPPTEPTYLCNWDISVGAVAGECTTEFLVALMRSGSVFGFTFDDVENALVPYSAVVFYDVAFARVSVESVQLWLHIEEVAFLLSTGTIGVEFNDWARSHYSKRTDIKVPNVQISCVNAESAGRHKSRYQRPAETEACFRTDINLAIIGRKFHFTEERKLQQELVRREDQRTHRTQFLLFPQYMDDFFPEAIDPPAQCAPPPPPPAAELEPDEGFSYTTGASRRSKGLRRQSSFLSFSSSNSRSVLRQQESLKPPSRHTQSIRPDSRRSTNSRRPLSSNLEYSISADQHSAYYSTVGDVAKEPPMHPSVAFSSQYFAPHFPLDGVRPGTREAPSRAMADEEEDLFNTPQARLEDIPQSLDEEHVYSSVLVELPTGISAFVNPTSIRYVASLMEALQPSGPEDLLDIFQADAMTRIFDLQKEKQAKGHIKDFLVRIPKVNFRLLNSALSDPADFPTQEQDQYDLTISSVALVTRTTTDWEDPFKPETVGSRTSLDLRLGEIGVSASERLSSFENPQAAVMAQIDRVFVSLGSKDVKYLDIDIGSVEGSTSSGKIEYLASLIHRTGSVASEVGKLLVDTVQRNETRQKYFAYRLLKEGQSTNDPSFLIRPSAVLRSAQGHLRTFDSWKLAMRLRQIWTTMGPQARDKLVADCWDDTPVLPPGAPQLAIAAFQRWRSWDLEDLPNAVLLKNIFGKLGDTASSSVREVPFLGACRLGSVQFILDPGPKQNRIGVTDLSARIDRKTPSVAEQAEQAARPLTVLNISCGEACINLNWELCELADDILRLYNRNRRQSEQSQVTQIIDVAPLKKDTDSPSDFHIVLDVGRGSIELETINLYGRALSDGLRVSMLKAAQSDMSDSINVVFNCNSVTTKLQTHSRLLGLWRLQEPSIFVSYELQETEEASFHTIKSTASSRSLHFTVKEDPIGLMEVMDLLCRDEVTQLYRIKGQIPAGSPQPKESKKISDRLSSFRVNVAMFLDEYVITIPLLQSLTYKITGTVARAAVAANFGKELVFDFDIKENYHEMQISVRNQPRSISLLQIPPTNGRITSHITGSEHLVTVLSSVEVIQLDASAVYSLLTALNRPQVSSAIQEVQQQSKLIQDHFAEIFDTRETTAPEVQDETKTKLVYNVHMTMAGLEVSAKTSLKSELEPNARVLFALDKAHLQASNRHEPSGPILNYPELHVNLRKIGLDIRRGQEEGAMRSCGNFGAGVTVSASSKPGEDGKEDWSFNFRSDDFELNLAPETVSTVVEVLGYMGEKIKDLDTSRELDYLRKLRHSKPRITLNDNEELPEDGDILDSVLASVIYNFELRNIRVCWIVADERDSDSGGKEDLVLSVKLFQFGTRTKKSARLSIEKFQLQMVPPGQDQSIRSLHSALLPEVTFNIAYMSNADSRRMAFQAVGESLDLRLTSAFIVPAANLMDSITLSMKNVQQVSDQWKTSTVQQAKKPDATPAPQPRRSLFGNKRLENLLVDADFAGAVVYISSRRPADEGIKGHWQGRPSLAGKYGQFNTDDSGSGADLHSPGLAWKVEYRDNGLEDPSLYGEIKIDASSNILYPSVVPIFMEMMSSVKEVVKDRDSEVSPSSPKDSKPAKPAGKAGNEDNILTSDPSTVLGRMKLNLGMRICRQEFSLSCQPIARVAATTHTDNVYITINTVRSQDHGNFFAISGNLEKLHASVQHVYSRESTASFEIDHVTLSFMNSKHVSGTSGVSSILNVSPMQMSVNAKQAQDFLLFREIWYPEELRQAPAMPVTKPSTETSQGHLVQRYQQVAATAAFPWTATISIAALDITVDMGQAIGRSAFAIKKFWVSSKKTSDWEQNLCLGFDKIGIDCTGRLSGFIALQDFRLRTSIQWPNREEALIETPLVQASLGFNEFQLKAAFDYQAFLVADITSLEFLMYNVRDGRPGKADRLVAIADGEAVQIFGTTTSAAQGIALWQAIKKLIQERKENLEGSIKEIEKYMRRRSNTSRSQQPPATLVPKLREEDTMSKSPISLDTDVVVTLKALNLGVFPNTFSDHQVFKMEALNAYARFAASVEQKRVHSILRMTLGQLRIGLAGVRNAEAPKTLSEISVEDVIQRATGSRGGTILKVPQVSAVMETWQVPDRNHIEYIFKSAFEGKVEVGWNYSRISYIRDMWAKHAKSVEQTWGRELPMTAVKITGVPETKEEQTEGEQQRTTVQVDLPQSRYDYVALEPPIIETPQLRDMGEATPPLEWIGLHRDRLPNLTHQIVIVSLLELAGEVEDAYCRILGSS